MIGKCLKSANHLPSLSLSLSDREMSTALLQYVAECFQGKLEGMHCLGAVSGVDSASSSGGTSASSSSLSPVAVAAAAAAAGGVCSRGAVMSVVRALGVLVCEGRLQGPPRGYREGPHCAAPLQPLTNDHVCEKDNYLCARYIVLVREIAERISVGSPLSVVVSMCTDCPCGLARATCKKPAAPTLIASGPLTQWQLTSDVLLEYWSISVVPSKNSETMNAQGLYQAVRSRLHFSQVAAWWSRSNGTRPSYVTTRITPHGDENLRKFRGIPIEHTFPLAAIGDGNSIKVTVWALPRMEEVPTLFCPLHPTNEKEDAARALTPTKIGPLVASSNSQIVDNLVLPVLVDDRLQTACDKPGKHHCHCEDEETSPPSMMIMMMRPNGERKRRRSLPCGPTGQETTGAHHPQIALPPVRETGLAASLQEATINSLLYANNNNNNNSATVSNRNELYDNTYLSTGSLERRFRKQASLEETGEKDPDAVQDEHGLYPEDEGNDEKRYKPSIDPGSVPEEAVKQTSSSPMPVGVLVPSETSTRRENISNNLKSSPACTVHRHYPRMGNSAASTDRSNDLTDLMSKLSFPVDKKPRDDRRVIPDWLEAPRSTATLPTCRSHRAPDEEPSDVRLRNGSLELSQREFNEVLAVLRARTPITRRRAPTKSLRRRERGNEETARNVERDGIYVCPVHRDKRRVDVSCDCETRDSKPPANVLDSIGPRENSRRPGDALLGAILRTSERTGLADAANGARPRKILVGCPKANDLRRSEEHERYLPNVFNKRLSRLRQLFQKELGERAHNEAINSRETTEALGTPDEEQRNRRSLVLPRSGHSEATLLLPYATPAKSHATPIKAHRNANNPQVGNGQCQARSRRNDNAENHDDETTEKGVPSASEQEQFRRSFENAASMVFHSRTGLPLTSSPAPLRRGHCCFDYDSTLNSVSSKRSALFELNTPPSPGAVSLEETDREIEISGEGDETPKRQSTTRIRPQSHALLGSFEESALNGRLEPVSTVHGFTAELGASGSFCPKHRKLPVTVFFYTLGDNDKVSTPYLAHINLGKKGYQVPRSGTIQVTLLNPLGTVVKMFVVLYDLSDMPPRSHTFLRQRTLRDKTLRYLVHLRFMSGKSGRIYLHTDIRMIICRKSDVDTASDFGSEPPKELRSYIHGPTNPKFSPRC